MNFFPRSVSLLAVAALFQNSAPAKPAASTSTFHSDSMHLDFTYDSALKSAADLGATGIQQARNEATGKAHQAADCVSAPLTAVDDSAGVRMAVILRWDGACLSSLQASVDLSSLATASLKGSLQRFGDGVTGSATPYTLSSHPAAAAFGTVKSEKYGATFYAAVTCATQGADTLCWELLTNECGKLPTMMAYPVAFDAKPAEALIPARLAPPCS